MDDKDTSFTDKNIEQFYKLSGGGSSYVSDFINSSSGIVPIYHCLPIDDNDLYLDGLFYRFGVKGEGSCFFHSFCLAMNILNYHQAYLDHNVEECQRIAQDTRCSCVSNMSVDGYHAFLEDEKKLTPNTFQFHNVVDRQRELIDSEEQLHDKFCNLYIWADEPMIRMISRQYNLNILALDISGNKLYCGVHGIQIDSQPLLLIAWTDRKHFEPIGRFISIDKDNIQVQFLFHPGKDQKIIDYIMHKYDLTCPCVRSK